MTQTGIYLKHSYPQTDARCFRTTTWLVIRPANSTRTLFFLTLLLRRDESVVPSDQPVSGAHRIFSYRGLDHDQHSCTHVDCRLTNVDGYSNFATDDFSARLAV